MTPEHSSLAAAIVAAQAQARAVEKDGRNAYAKYDYVSAEAMIASARSVLADNGLAFVLVSSELDGSTPPNVRAAWKLIHKSGESWDVASEMPAIEGKQRPLDKAVATALTYAQNYALRGLLNLPRVEKGTEVDARDDSDYVEAGHRQRRESPSERSERKAGEDESRKLYEAFKKRYIAIALQYQAETGTPKEAMRDAIAELVGRDRWPDRPTLQDMKEAIHSLDVALKEIKETGNG